MIESNNNADENCVSMAENNLNGNNQSNCDQTSGKMSSNAPKKVADLSELIQECRKIFSNNEVDIEQVQNLLYSYQSNPKDWKQFAHFDRFKWVLYFLELFSLDFARNYLKTQSRSSFRGFVHIFMGRKSSRTETRTLELTTG